MRENNFDLPVTISTERTGRLLTVTRTVQAAEFLLNRGPEYRSVLKAMIDVMEQRKAVSVARKAFAAAARKANVLIREGCRDAG